MENYTQAFMQNLWLCTSTSRQHHVMHRGLRQAWFMDTSTDYLCYAATNQILSTKYTCSSIVYSIDYSLPTLIPIFLTAEQKARQHRARQLLQQTNPQTCSLFENINRRTVNPKDEPGVFFHLQYHPSNPSASDIQKIWRRQILTPPNAIPLYQLRNEKSRWLPCWHMQTHSCLQSSTQFGESTLM